MRPIHDPLAHLLLCGALIHAAAAAQTVYRCGAAGNQYSHQPCPDGRSIDASDPRTAEQASQARAELRAQERWATLAARERRASELAHPPALASGIRIEQTSAADPQSRRNANRPGKPQGPRSKKSNRTSATHQADFVAIDPASRKAQKGISSKGR